MRVASAAAKGAVVLRVARVRADAPFGVVERPVGAHGARLEGLAAHDVARCVLELGDRIGVDLAEGVGRVVVGADEIGGYLGRGAMAHGIAHPGVPCRRRAADLQASVDRLERGGGAVVEREVRGLIAGPEERQSSARSTPRTASSPPRRCRSGRSSGWPACGPARPNPASSRGGVMLALVVEDDVVARRQAKRGMNDSSTISFMPMETRKSKMRSVLKNE